MYWTMTAPGYSRYMKPVPCSN